MQKSSSRLTPADASFFSNFNAQIFWLLCSISSIGERNWRQACSSGVCGDADLSGVHISQNQVKNPGSFCNFSRIQAIEGVLFERTSVLVFVKQKRIQRSYIKGILISASIFLEEPLSALPPHSPFVTPRCCLFLKIPPIIFTPFVNRLCRKRRWKVNKEYTWPAA